MYQQRSSGGKAVGIATAGGKSAARSIVVNGEMSDMKNAKRRRPVEVVCSTRARNEQFN
jgi:hypothetical protein